MTTLADYLHESISIYAENPTEADPHAIACLILPADSTKFEKGVLANAVEAWARAYVSRFPK
ncbi:hypothetical protein WT14_22815 [Burkholderia stagnalis]|nr:hypothetical protein WT14_22815 [Burkholderia stagnalis]